MADGKQKAVFYYAVARGFTPGIYNVWVGPTGAKIQTKGFGGAKFKKFTTRAEAEHFNQTHATQAEETETASDTTATPDNLTTPRDPVPAEWRRELAEAIAVSTRDSTRTSSASPLSTQNTRQFHDVPHEAEKFILNRLTKLKTLHASLPRPPATEPVDRQDLTQSIVTTQ